MAPADVAGVFRGSESGAGMTRTEHLLIILAEESVEVAQRATKALRFTLEEVQPDQTLTKRTNAERIMQEYADLIAVVEMLLDEGSLDRPRDMRSMVAAKKLKVENFLKYSRERGTLEGK